MSHTSPSTYLVWALLSSLLFCFLVFHLWSFDRFHCLRWNSTPYSGAFKRVMTYSYLLSVPLIMVYSIGFATIKYLEGYTFIALHGIVPTPYQLWTPTHRAAILPLSLCFAVAWSFEMVTHLEELCFWLFLVNAGSAQQNWFKSGYFKLWALGSLVAVVYMPLVTVLTRSDPLKNEAYTFLAGSLGSLSLTIWFLPVLWTFPSFLRNLKAEGVDLATIVRLTKFSEMNTIRVVFRFLFTLPLLCLGVDGVTPHTHVNESAFWTDILAILAAMGCIVSSGLTLVIFFPRSIESEIQAKDASREQRRQHKAAPSSAYAPSPTPYHAHNQSLGAQQDTHLLSESPVHRVVREEPETIEDDPLSPFANAHAYHPKLARESADGLHRPPSRSPSLPLYTPNRRVSGVGGGVEIGHVYDFDGSKLTSSNLAKHEARQSRLNPLVHNFRSPIDVIYETPQPRHRPRMMA